MGNEQQEQMDSKEQESNFTLPVHGIGSSRLAFSKSLKQCGAQVPLEVNESWVPKYLGLLGKSCSKNSGWISSQMLFFPCYQLDVLS